MQLVPVALCASVCEFALASFHVFPSKPSWLAIFVCVGLVSAGLRGRNAAALLSVALFLLANLYYQACTLPHPDSSSLDALQRKVQITGTFLDVQTLDGMRSRADLEVTRIMDGNRRLPLLKPLHVRLYVGEGPLRFLPGDVVSMQTPSASAAHFRNARGIQLAAFSGRRGYRPDRLVEDGRRGQLQRTPAGFCKPSSCRLATGGRRAD